MEKIAKYALNTISKLTSCSFVTTWWFLLFSTQFAKLMDYGAKVSCTDCLSQDVPRGLITELRFYLLSNSTKDATA